jgi:hypothetical protein
LTYSTISPLVMARLIARAPTADGEWAAAGTSRLRHSTRTFGRGKSEHTVISM